MLGVTWLLLKSDSFQIAHSFKFASYRITVYPDKGLERESPARLCMQKDGVQNVFTVSSVWQRINIPHGIYIFKKNQKKLKSRKPSNASACEWAEDVQTAVELRKMARYGGTHLGPLLVGVQDQPGLRAKCCLKKKVGGKCLMLLAIEEIQIQMRSFFFFLATLETWEVGGVWKRMVSGETDLATHWICDCHRLSKFDLKI